METIYYLILSIRPHQWIKNLFIFAAIVFSGHLFIIGDFLLTIAGFLIFSVATSATYLLNDIADIKNDKLHPIKSQRPLPSGKLQKATAISVSLAFIIVAVLLSFYLNLSFGLIIAGYLLLNILYSFVVKSLVILDVMSIAFGFVLRVAAGAVLINVPISEWLIICTILLALFLGFSKRRAELVLLDNNANDHRSVLGHYSPQFLDQMIGIVTASTVMSYALYTISEETVKKFQTTYLIYTVPFVLYGIFRYLYLIHKREEGGNPTLAIIKDVPMIINLILWVVVASLIIYWR